MNSSSQDALADRHQQRQTNNSITNSASTTRHDILNPFKTSFDPVQALRSAPEATANVLPHLKDKVTFRNASPLNNLSACIHLEIAPYRVLQRRQQQQAVKASNVSSTKLTSRAGMRKGEADKGATNVKRNKRICGVLQSLMDKISVGPFSTLATAVAQRRRVRIVLRDRHSIRGSMIARLIAYDKHFNLVIRDGLLRHDGTGEEHQENGKSTGRDERFQLTIIRGENVVLVELVKTD